MLLLHARLEPRRRHTRRLRRLTSCPDTPFPLAKTGIQVTFAGTNLRNNDFWIIAARPETPNVFVPWELSNGRSPHGVRRWIAPLGIIHWPRQAERLRLTMIVVRRSCRSLGSKAAAPTQWAMARTALETSAKFKTPSMPCHRREERSVCCREFTVPM